MAVSFIGGGNQINYSILIYLYSCTEKGVSIDKVVSIFFFLKE
jgi:hypothetical protein